MSALLALSRRCLSPFQSFQARPPAALALSPAALILSPAAIALSPSLSSIYPSADLSPSTPSSYIFHRQQGNPNISIPTVDHKEVDLWLLRREIGKLGGFDAVRLDFAYQLRLLFCGHSDTCLPPFPTR